MLHWNKALWLVKRSHMTWNIQCFIQHNVAILLWNWFLTFSLCVMLTLVSGSTQGGLGFNPTLVTRKRNSECIWDSLAIRWSGFGSRQWNYFPSKKWSFALEIIIKDLIKVRKWMEFGDIFTKPTDNWVSFSFQISLHRHKIRRCGIPRMSQIRNGGLRS